MSNIDAAAAVAEEVRSMAARKRYSQTKVAAVLGCSQAAVSRMFRGAVPFDVNELDALAREWNVPITDFFPKTDRQGGSGARTSGWSGRSRQDVAPAQERRLVGAAA